MSGSHTEEERISEQVYASDTYAQRVAQGSSQESHSDHNAEPNGFLCDELIEDNKEEHPYGYSQYRVLSEFEKEHFHLLNMMPDHPCTAFFRAGSELSSKHIFDSLHADGIPANAVRCLQRKPTGETLITFTTEKYCCKFLDNSAFFVCNQGYRQGYLAHPVAGELTFLTIYDAPYEMPYSATEERFKSYCTVYSRHRGKLQGYPDVTNGLGHNQVQLKASIPCYLRFGKFQLRFYHDGQTKTCRRCGAADHIAHDCVNEAHFNCDKIGHLFVLPREDVMLHL